jgi:hypothetical protein
MYALGASPQCEDFGLKEESLAEGWVTRFPLKIVKGS